jgi:TonB family protein
VKNLLLLILAAVCATTANTQWSISISAKSLLTEVQHNKARYVGKKVLVTGVVTGVFIPSLDTSLRVAAGRGTSAFDEKGGATSFVTMGGPYPHSIEETLLIPGIVAWSKKDGQLQPAFGQSDVGLLAGQLVVGKEASLLCSFSSSDIQVTLEDCTLEHASRVQTQQPDITLPASQPVHEVDRYPEPAPYHGLDKIGGDVSSPIALNNVEAEFSEEAKRIGLQGVCLIKMIVDAQGLPRKPFVVRGLGHGLDEAAIKAVRQYRFKPAYKRDVGPVPVAIMVQVNFKLYK